MAEPKPFDTAYEPATHPFFVYDSKYDRIVAVGTYAECERFVAKHPQAFLDIRRNN